MFSEYLLLNKSAHCNLCLCLSSRDNGYSISRQNCFLSWKGQFHAIIACTDIDMVLSVVGGEGVLRFAHVTV